MHSPWSGVWDTPPGCRVEDGRPVTVQDGMLTAGCSRSIWAAAAFPVFYAPAGMLQARRRQGLVGWSWQSPSAAAVMFMLPGAG